MCSTLLKASLTCLVAKVALARTINVGWLGGQAPLSENGYQLVASLKSDFEMSNFIKRFLFRTRRTILNEGEFNGLVPFYSGTSGVQDFATLKQELASAPWITSIGAPELRDEAMPKQPPRHHPHLIRATASDFRHLLTTSSSQEEEALRFESDPTASAEFPSMATAWKTAFDQEICQRRIKVEKQFRNDMYCKMHAPVLYSKAVGMAYMTTPRPLVRSFEEFFMSQFPDARRLDNSERVPKDAFVFTFVSDPVVHLKNAYATVSVALDQHPAELAAMNINFQTWNTSLEGGNARFVEFLHDLDEGYFGRFAAHPLQLGIAATQTSGVICTRLKQMDFIGHVENFEADWAHIQKAARVPENMQTRAILHPNASAIELQRLRSDPNYTKYDDVEFSDRALQQICDFFGSDFVCLGYEAPQICQKRGPNPAKRLPLGA